jgi:uncharacterized protein
LIVVDTSGLLALIDPMQHDHKRVAAFVEHERGPFLLSTFILAELDYLLSTRVSVDAELAFLRRVGAGDYAVESFDDDEITAAAGLIERYRGQGIGLADASLVILAARAETNRILTLDERHFRMIRPVRGGAFTILPADA